MYLGDRASEGTWVGDLHAQSDGSTLAGEAGVSPNTVDKIQAHAEAMSLSKMRSETRRCMLGAWLQSRLEATQLHKD